MTFQMVDNILDKNVQQILMREARDSHERCGLILNNDVVVHISNVSINPSEHFEFDREAFLEIVKNRMDSIKGMWHTHPSKVHYPSDLDMLYIPFKPADWKYWIATTNGVFQYDFPA
jgi:proteasome lid subunit RPN8/RPN11